jgi:hypothetical protein
MEIPLFQTDEPQRIERCVLYPYPDLRRIWARCWLTGAQSEERPNLELVVLNPDGTENTSVLMLAHDELRAETTLHLRNPTPGATYPVVVTLSRGISATPEVLDEHEFGLTLEFRDPDTGEPGFGFGVDWDEVKRKAGRL